MPHLEVKEWGLDMSQPSQVVPCGWPNTCGTDDFQQCGSVHRETVGDIEYTLDATMASGEQVKEGVTPLVGALLAKALYAEPTG